MKGSDLKIAAALAVTAVLAACAPARVPTAPRPAPAPVTAPVTAAVPVRPAPVQPPAITWADAPPTPGTWRYGAHGGFSEAAFIGSAGQPLARLRCVSASRSVVLALPDTGSPRPRVTIRSHTATRTLEAQAGGRETLVGFAANEPLLDAMAFARGRFAIEADGLAPLYLPSWPEIARVIEDCR